MAGMRLGRTLRRMRQAPHRRPARVARRALDTVLRLAEYAADHLGWFGGTRSDLGEAGSEQAISIP